MKSSENNANHNMRVGKKAWLPEEDEKLLKLVDDDGKVANWSLIAQKLGTRSGKQCRERYHNHLKADIRKDEWTAEEDRIVNEGQLKYGNQWAKIAKNLHGRTDNAVKNRWHILHRIRPVKAIKNKTTLIHKTSPLTENFLPMTGKFNIQPLLSNSSVNINKKAHYDKPPIIIHNNNNNLKNSNSVPVMKKNNDVGLIKVIKPHRYKSITVKRQEYGSDLMDLFYNHSSHRHYYPDNSDAASVSDSILMNNNADEDGWMDDLINLHEIEPSLFSMTVYNSNTCNIDTYPLLLPDDSDITASLPPSPSTQSNISNSIPIDYNRLRSNSIDCNSLSTSKDDTNLSVCHRTSESTPYRDSPMTTGLRSSPIRCNKDIHTIQRYITEEPLK